MTNVPLIEGSEGKAIAPIAVYQTVGTIWKDSHPFLSQRLPSLYLTSLSQTPTKCQSKRVLQIGQGSINAARQGEGGRREDRPMSHFP